MGGFKDKDKQRAIVKENFKKYVESINKIPSYNEMRKTPIGFKYLSASSIERNFGSYNTLLEELGYEKNKQPNQYNNLQTFTDTQIVESIHRVCGKSGCYTTNYYHNHKKIDDPGLKSVKSHFGMWYDFLVDQKIIKSYRTLPLQSGQQSVRYFIECNDGHECDSTEEAVIDYWLSKNNIIHKVHVKYIDSRFISDYFIPSLNTYIEYAGMSEIPSRCEEYNKRLAMKCQHAKEYGAEVIVVYRKDLDNLDEVLKSLINCPLKTNSN